MAAVNAVGGMVMFGVIVFRVVVPILMAVVAIVIMIMIVRFGGRRGSRTATSNNGNAVKAKDG